MIEGGSTSVAADMNGDANLHQTIDRFAAALAACVVKTIEHTPEGQVQTHLPHPFSNMSWQDWRRSIALWREFGRPSLQALPKRECPACGASDSDFLFESYDAYPYHECTECRTWYVPLVVDHSLFDRYFDKVPEARRFGDYTDAQYSDPAAERADRDRFSGYYRDIAMCLARNESSPPAVLDIGCGVANSLAVAAELGMHTRGLEVNEHAVRIARELGREVGFPNELPASEKFDAVTLWESLEHIADPMPVLATAREMLVDDGILAITVPNLNSPCIRSLRGDSLQIHGGPAWPGHINLFTPDTLERLLHRAGFRVFHTCGQYSMNLEEVLGYHFGRWSGARDYLAAEQVGFELPGMTRQICEKLSSVIATWENAHAFAPIMRVFAVRSDGKVPAGFANWEQQRKAGMTSELEVNYGLAPSVSPLSGFGTPISFEANSWMSPQVLISGGRLRISTLSTDPGGGYLWLSDRTELEAGGVVRISGLLFTGGLSVGLLCDDKFVASDISDSAGAFCLELPVEASQSYTIAISNHSAESNATQAEIFGVDLMQP